MHNYNVLIVERYTTPEGATIISHYCYVLWHGWACRCNSCGQIVERAVYVGPQSDAVFALKVAEWHSSNVAHKGASVEWHFYN
jgi:hypothetical protein